MKTLIALVFPWIPQTIQWMAKSSPTNPRSWISSFCERTSCRIRLQKYLHSYYRQKSVAK